MKLSTTTPIIASLIVATTTGVSAAGRNLKASKGHKHIPSKCRNFPRIFTEPSVTDIGKPNDDDPLLFVWQNNKLCAGDIQPYGTDGEPDESRCRQVGTASGTCTILVDEEECDSVDTWDVWSEVEGEMIGTISSRGIAYKPGDSIVLGGTGCFENAGGTIASRVLYADEEEELEYWQYDLSNVQLH
mmetsp:Transcript_46271/g.46965  ORF Transcript_46271/g.46965 Transcript_46271/m.46965 type:complete len:187 (+) Transcript_46271:93-653(+)